MSRLRLAVIGAGHLGRIHARLAKAMDLFQLVGVVDPVDSARRQAVEELNVPVYEGHRALYGQIDAAVVAVPTVHHHSVAMDLLRQGVHVLVEKPLAMTGAEATDIVETANERGVVLQVGHIEQFNPALNAARSLIERPLYIDAVRTSGYTFRSTDIGVVLDLMIHDLDIVFSLVNSPIREIRALGVSVMGNHEDMAQVRLQFENGCVANLTASRASYCLQRTMQVFGEGIFLDLDFAAPALRVIRPVPQLQRRQFDFHNLSVHQREHYKQHLFDELLPIEDVQLESRNALLDELKDFGTAIRTRRAPHVTGQQGWDVITAAEQILAVIAAHAEEVRRDDAFVTGDGSVLDVVRPSVWPAEQEADLGRQRKAG